MCNVVQFVYLFAPIFHYSEKVLRPSTLSQVISGFFCLVAKAEVAYRSQVAESAHHAVLTIYIYR